MRFKKPQILCIHYTHRCVTPSIVWTNYFVTVWSRHHCNKHQINSHHTPINNLHSLNLITKIYSRVPCASVFGRFPYLDLIVSKHRDKDKTRQEDSSTRILTLSCQNFRHQISRLIASHIFHCTHWPTIITPDLWQLKLKSVTIALE